MANTKNLTIEEISAILGYDVNIVSKHNSQNLERIEIGSIKTIGNYEFIILDKYEDKVLAITKDFVFNNIIFDNNTNNYAESSIRDKLECEFLPLLTNNIPEQYIIEQDINLTSSDGLDDYGIVRSKVGLLTDELYRKYGKIIENYPVDGWWWLVTPFSTPHRNDNTFVRFVYGDGRLGDAGCCNRGGVRPFLIFDSNIF